MLHSLRMKHLITALVALLAASATPAFAASDWNGTWIGNWQNGNGIQLIMAGNEAIGIFWDGDYVPEELHTVLSADGMKITVTWDRSSAILTRTGEDTADVMVHQPNRADAAFAVKLDK